MTRRLRVSIVILTVLWPACASAMAGTVVQLAAGAPAAAQSYSTYTSWDAMDAAADTRYAAVRRISGTSGCTGFWFFGIEQFDATNRYAMAMTVYFENRPVTIADAADVGCFDLQDGNRWTKIGTTTAWNWQQGCRL